MRVVIQEDRLQDDWRGRRTGFDLLGIDHNETFDGGEPQTTIGCFAAGRLEAGRTGEGRHAIAKAVGQARDFRGETVCAAIELCFGDAEDATTRAEPQKPQPIILDAADVAVGQALSMADGGKAAVLIAAQASAGSAYPESAVRGGVKALYEVAGQAVSFSQMTQLAIRLEAPNAVSPRAEPDVAVAVL